MHTPRMSRQGSGAGSFSDRSKPGNKFDVYIFNAFRKIVNVVCATFVRSRLHLLGHVRGTLACAVSQCLTDEVLHAHAHAKPHDVAHAKPRHQVRGLMR